MPKTCLNPISCHAPDGHIIYYPCGRCPNCRDLARLGMASRFLLERSLHPERDTFFLTLTYNEDNLPSRGFSREHIDHFLNNLRKSLSRSFDATFRYMLVSEYGDLDNRQHYHFAVMTSKKFPYRLPIYELSPGFRVYTNDFVDTVRRLWPYGHVDDGGTPSPAAILYVTGYALKEDDFSVKYEDELREIWNFRHKRPDLQLPKRLRGLLPLIPFRRFSLRPGLGLDEKTVNFVFDYVYNDGVNYRFNINLGEGLVVPLPGIYISKFIEYKGYDEFAAFLKQIRVDKFDTELQDSLFESALRCPDSSLSNSIRAARIKKRKDEKLLKLSNQLYNIYRNET